jgi:hypothetical protein
VNKSNRYRTQLLPCLNWLLCILAWLKLDDTFNTVAAAAAAESVVKAWRWSSPKKIIGSWNYICLQTACFELAVLARLCRPTGDVLWACLHGINHCGPGPCIESQGITTDSVMSVHIDTQCKNDKQMWPRITQDLKAFGRPYNRCNCRPLLAKSDSYLFATFWWGDCCEHVYKAQLTVGN